ncbi:MAG: hypothetical protein FJ214_06020 [Ignavibacteria bacterium]|nr:hypothetical protein [Ignavibacteria bacterium]
MNNLKLFIKDYYTLPNLISIFRLLLAIPMFLVIQYINTEFVYRYYLLGLIFIATISDLLDGFIARKKNLISEFGKIIDPLADKVCVILIITQLYFLGEIISIYFWIIVGRDLLIFIGGIIVSKKIGKVLPSNLLGKITVITIGAFIIITVIDISKTNFLYHFFFYLSILMSVLSVFGYSLRALEVLRWNKNETI